MHLCAVGVIRTVVDFLNAHTFTHVSETIKKQKLSINGDLFFFSCERTALSTCFIGVMFAVFVYICVLVCTSVFFLFFFSSLKYRDSSHGETYVAIDSTVSHLFSACSKLFMNLKWKYLKSNRSKETHTAVVCVIFFFFYNSRTWSYTFLSLFSTVCIEI